MVLGLFSESNLDASIEVKKPEMLECDTAEGSVDNIHEYVWPNRTLKRSSCSWDFRIMNGC
jgi:hypothetical protein